MPTEQAKVEFDGNVLSVKLPMCQPTGKVRVKARTFFGEYGNPVSTRQNPLTQSCYIEWQIGYDLLARGNEDKTSLSSTTFNNYKNETKLAYELSEILYYSHKLGFISNSEIKETYNYISEIPENKLIDTIDNMRISRTNPIEANINGMSFYEMKVSYPLIVHKFGKYEIYTEIMNREKQKGVGVQPMLYVCIPITELTFGENPIGRVLNVKEYSKWVIGKDEAKLSLELFKMFGMLSKKHQFDICSIMKMLFDI